MNDCLLQVCNLKKYFRLAHRDVLHAVDDVSFSINRGETVGIVGESGCGKTTLGRTILGLYRPNGGKIVFDGTDIGSASKKELHAFKKRAQIILQDPYASFNPRMTISQIISEGMEAHNLYKTKKEREDAVYSLLETVGLVPEHANRFPHEFSGGQRQRIGIARALAVEPDFIVCDEPISSLDVSIQAQIINLLIRLQKEFKMTYLFIAHDLSIVKYISDKVGVMYSGKLVEFAKSAELYKKPLHPYSQALISAIPSTDIASPMYARRIHIKGEISSAINPPQVCRFYKRCPKAFEKCKSISPDLVEIESGHFAACHLLNDKT
ncbi:MULTISPECIES: ABC transporter ATP-binding protein [unclassified Treponema]|uniref:ABC transporter ATP-binding protein n=1 Tax=unclassified Treponema TaxID=2638727 RepID=UPI0020A2693C|nr:MULTISPECIES: ABC transporter ATP-binding protein [unclassified Treponema]UTC66504.1 ABC transporter ATP-binding protein [Treponema sp. OMZ 789]UTC69236.1 ABC transporter ATP-binding protein [Treponema sp. OMZ 790]UTC71949.1 ABC transporter ATP-binding protein [Treponema sp. OMZ 791]